MTNINKTATEFQKNTVAFLTSWKAKKRYSENEFNELFLQFCMMETSTKGKTIEHLKSVFGCTKKHLAPFFDEDSLTTKTRGQILVDFMKSVKDRDNLSMAQLMDKTGLTLSHLKNLMSNPPTNPQDTTIDHICNGFGVTADDIFGPSTPTPKKPHP